MPLTLTPIIDASCTFPSFEPRLDRDLARMARLFEPSIIRFSDLTDTIENREPNYLYEENEQQAQLQVELPGVTKDNISVNVEANYLVISARRFGATAQHTGEDNNEKSNASDNPEDKETKSDQEKPEQSKPWVTYKLKLRIPRRYDTDNITASMQGDGILSMAIPINKNKSTRAITIQ